MSRRRKDRRRRRKRKNETAVILLVILSGSLETRALLRQLSEDKVRNGLSSAPSSTRYAPLP